MDEKQLFPELFLQHNRTLAQAGDALEIARALRDSLVACADHGTVFLYEYHRPEDPTPHLVEVTATRDQTGEELLPLMTRYLWEDFPLSSVVPEAGVRWLSSNSEDSDLAPEVKALLSDTLGLSRGCLVPLKLPGHCVGCLLAGWRDGTEPPQDFQPFAEALATQAAGQLVRQHELEAVRRDLQDALLAVEDVRVFLSLVENAGDAIDIIDLDGIPVYVNSAFMNMYGFDSTSEAMGADSAMLTVPEDLAQLESEILPQAQVGMWQGNLRRLRRDGTSFTAALTVFGVQDQAGELFGIATIARDVTQSLQLEQSLREQAQLREEVIAVQQQLIQELSTPIIPLTDEILVMPLIGSIDSRRSQQIMETMLDTISQRQASVIIIDITGVSVVDTSVANHLLNTAQAARLLGTECMLVGIAPEVAQTMVQLGVSMKGQLGTLADMQTGIERALRKTGRRIVAL